jgi:hypothetical protein
VYGTPFRKHGPLRGPLIPPKIHDGSSNPIDYRFFEPGFRGFMCFSAFFIFSF